jgi:chromosome segregation ATPase
MRTPLRESLDPNQMARGSVTTPARKSIVSGLFAHASAQKQPRLSLAPVDANTALTAGGADEENAVARTLADDLFFTGGAEFDAPAAVDDEVAQMRKLNAEYETKISNLTEMYIAEHNRLLKLKAEHDDATKDSRAMYADFLAKKTELKDALERCDALQAQLHAQKTLAAADVVDAQLADARAQIHSLSDALLAQRTATQAAEQAQRELAGQMQALQDTCRQLQSALADAQEEIALMQQVEQQHQHEHASQPAQPELSARLETLQIQNELLRDELSTLRANGESAEKLRAESAAQREQYEEQLAELKRTHRRERVELSERLTGAERAGALDRQTLADERAARQAERAAHAAELESASAASNERRDAALARLSEERDEALGRCAALDGELAAARAAASVAEESASAACEERDAAQRAASTASDEAQELRAGKANLENDLHLLYRKHKADLARLEDEYRQSDYKTRYEALVSERDVLRARVDAAMQLAERVTRLSGLEDAFGAEVARAAAAMQTRYDAIARADDRWQQHAARADARARECELRTAAMQRECEQLRALQASHSSVVASLEASLAAARSQVAAANQTLEAERESLAHELIEVHEREAAVSERLRDSQATLAQLRAEQQELAEFVEEERQIRQDEYAKLEATHTKTLALLNEARAAAEAAVSEAVLREAASLERAAAEVQSARDQVIVLRFEAVQMKETRERERAEHAQRAALDDELRANLEAQLGELQAEYELQRELHDAQRLQDGNARSAAAEEADAATLALADVQARCDAKESELQRLEEAMATAAAERRAAVERAAMATAALSEQRERLAFLEHEREQHVANHTQIVEPLNETIVAQQMALDDALQRMQAAEKRADELAQQCSAAKEAGNALRQRAETELRRLRQRATDAAEQLARADAMLNERSNETDALKEALEASREELRGAQQAREQTATENALLSRDVEELQVQMDIMLLELDKDAPPEAAARVRELNDAATLQRQVSKLEIQHDAAQQTIAALRRDFASLRDYCVQYKEKAVAKIRDLQRRLREQDVGADATGDVSLQAAAEQN